MIPLVQSAPVSGWRAELMARLIAAGPQALDDGEALQLTCGAGPQQIEALLAEFGSLPEVLGAEPAALARIVSPARAERLALARDLARRLLVRPLRVRAVLPRTSAVCDYLRAQLGGRVREEFHVLFLDRRNRLIRDELMGRGTVDHAPAYPREVMRRALELAASALILAHNHPGGDPAPSRGDIEITHEIAAAGRTLRIAVHDHLIVAGEQVVSLKGLGVL